jgi:hypothetical protein
MGPHAVRVTGPDLPWRVLKQMAGSVAGHDEGRVT